jgi:casein kinase 1
MTDNNLNDNDKDKDNIKKKYCGIQEYDIIGDHYILEKQIGSGSFGEVFECIRKSDNRILAAKTENYFEDECGNMKKSKLLLEKKIYRILDKNGVKHIPKIYGYFQGSKIGHSHIMVMSLLGQSLDKIFEKYNNKLNLGSIIKLGIDLVSIIKRIHKAGIIHRDIKPNNFMIGKYNKSYVYIMDFGLSKKYITNNGKHMEYSTGRSLIGTPRYSSLNVHMGIEPGRRDDLESIGYMLIYFLKGKLPWQGLKLPANKKHTDKNKTKQRKLNQIYYVKKTTSVKKLCQGLPNCFIEYIEYVRKLNFYDEPNYDYLIKLFNNTIKNHSIDVKYEWDKK